MKTVVQYFGLVTILYFASVPPKMDNKIQTIKYSDESIILDNEIDIKLKTIELEKQKIYVIQKELNIK